MMKKVCPICDLPLGKLNYCPSCRRIIRHPVYWKADYCLNNQASVRRPVKEIKGREQAVTQTKQEQFGDKKAAKTGRNIIIALAGIIAGTLLISVIASCYLYMQMISSGVSDSAAEEAYEETDYDFTELDDETVRERGIPCNGYGHFQTDGRTLAMVMQQFIEESEYGYTIDSFDIYSNNYDMEEQGIVISWYETIYSLTLKDSDNESVYQYIDVNYDTATGALHEYQSSLCSKEASLSYLEHFLRMVEEREASGGKDLVLDIMTQAAAGIEQKNGTLIVEGAFEISIYPTESGVGVYVAYYEPGGENEQEL